MLVLCSAAQPGVHFCVHAWWVFGSEDVVRAYLSLRARSVRCTAFETSRRSWYTSALTRTTHANKRMHTNTHITHAHRRQQIRLGTADTRGACSSLLASSIRLQPPSDPLTPSRTLTQVTLSRAATGWAGFVEGVSTWWSSSRSPPPAAAAAGEQQPPPGTPSASGGGVVTCVCVCMFVAMAFDAVNVFK